MTAFDLISHPICFSRPQRVATSAWRQHVPFGFLIVDLVRPEILVELGTHCGVSYCAFCQAVQELRLGTRCYAIDTWEGDSQTGFYGSDVLPELKDFHDVRYGGFSSLVRSTFDQGARHFDDGSVDLLHIDGFHTYEAVRHDFETWRPKLSHRGVVLFHDTNCREREFGVWRLWRELKQDRPHFEFVHGHGLGVLAVGSEIPAALHAFFQATATHAHRIRQFFFQLGSRIDDDYSLQLLKGRCQSLEESTPLAIARLESTLNDARTAAGTAHERAEAECRRADAESQRADALATRVGELEARQAELTQRLEISNSVDERLDEIEELLHEMHDAQTHGPDAAGNASVKTEYLELVRRVRSAVRKHTRRGSSVLVVSKGDERLTERCGRRAGHFPQNESGQYAGHHPADSDEAIRLLEKLRASGAEYLVVPESARWWFDHYAQFGEHLRRRYRLVADVPRAAALFCLTEPSDLRALDEWVERFGESTGRTPAILDWETGWDLRSLYPYAAVFHPPDAGSEQLPYLSDSIDLVAVSSDARRFEAARVARTAVAVLGIAEADRTPRPPRREDRRFALPSVLIESKLRPPQEATTVTAAATTAAPSGNGRHYEEVRS